MTEQPPANDSAPDRDILRQKVQLVRDSLRRLRQTRDEGKAADPSEWPEAVRRLAGAWEDFSEVEALRAGLGEDLPREPL